MYISRYEFHFTYFIWTFEPHRLLIFQFVLGGGLTVYLLNDVPYCQGPVIDEWSENYNKLSQKNKIFKEIILRVDSLYYSWN